MEDHLTTSDYLATLRGEAPAGALHDRCRRHLLETCDACGAAHRRGASHEGGTAVDGGEREELVALPARPADPRALALADVEVAEAYLSACRRSQREAREDLAKLLDTDPASWRRRVERSQRRFRSRCFAALLVEEARRRVRTAPHESQALAELVAPALDRRPGRLGEPWARELLLRAAAQRANALRVAGDLTAAAAAFLALRPDLLQRTAGGGRLEAEILSLEASLAIDQRDTGRAEALLRAALRLYADEGAGDGTVRAQVKLANLLQADGRAEEVEPLLQRAAVGVDPAAAPYLYRCILHGRLTALLDLDRPGAAADLLREERGLYLAAADEHARAALRFLEARIHLGLRHYAEAEAGFGAARDQLLAVDRGYDAVLASLYQADALLAAGDNQRAGELAQELVPMFRQRGVARETLASLRLLAEAARAEALTQAVVSKVRRQVQEAASG